MERFNTPQSGFNWKHYFGMILALIGLVAVVFAAMTYYGEYAARQEQEALDEFVEEQSDPVAAPAGGYNY